MASSRRWPSSGKRCASSSSSDRAPGSEARRGSALAQIAVHHSAGHPVVVEGKQLDGGSIHGGAAVCAGPGVGQLHEQAAVAQFLSLDDLQLSRTQRLAPPAGEREVSGTSAVDLLLAGDVGTGQVPLVILRECSLRLGQVALVRGVEQWRLPLRAGSERRGGSAAHGRKGRSPSVSPARSTNLVVVRRALGRRGHDARLTREQAPSR